MRNPYPKKTAEKEDGASKVIFDFSGEVEQKERKKKKNAKVNTVKGACQEMSTLMCHSSEFQKAGISTIRNLIKHIIIYSFFYIHEYHQSRYN